MRAATTLVPVDEAQVESIVARPRRVGCRVADRRADQLVRQRRARAADRRNRRARLSGLPGDALLRRAPRVPRVRARTDGVHELVRAAEGATYVEQLQSALRRDRRHGGGQHPPLGRGPDDDGARPRATRSTACSRARPGGVAGALCTSARRPASTTSSPSTWAAPRRTSPSARTASRRSAARRRSAISGSRCRRSTCTRSARAAARSRTCRS